MQVHCCPICSKKIVVETGGQGDSHFPFCSKRCRMVDLGHWFSDQYVIRSGSPEGPEESEAEDKEA